MSASQEPRASQEPSAFQEPDDPPPILRNWTRVYLVVLLNLVLVILALYAFMRFFS